MTTSNAVERPVPLPPDMHEATSAVALPIKGPAAFVISAEEQEYQRRVVDKLKAVAEWDAKDSRTLSIG